MIQISDSSSRSDRYAICLLSGDHDGSNSDAGACVSRVRSVPVRVDRPHVLVVVERDLCGEMRRSRVRAGWSGRGSGGHRRRAGTLRCRTARAGHETHEHCGRRERSERVHTLGLTLWGPTVVPDALTGAPARSGPGESERKQRDTHGPEGYPQQCQEVGVRPTRGF
jgi:hypothetical protein